MNWYYVDAGKQTGPISDEQLDELFRAGTIKPETLLWREGMADWKPYSEARGAASTGAAGTGAEAKAEAVCAECGKILPVEETIRYGDTRVCAACKPVFLQKLQEGASLNAGDVRYAGFWIRVAAKLLDGLIIGVPMVIVMIIIMIPMFRGMGRQPNVPPTLPLAIHLLQLVFFLVQAGYVIILLGKYGATVGQMACGIKVITSDGGPISYGRATGRFFAEILSGLICYIGYIMVAFDGQKRALHDHICNTRVVYK